MQTAERREDVSLEHERLDVYQCVLEFIEVSHPAASSPPKGYGDLGNQLRRASSSMSLNIAEGYGQQTDKQKRKFYNYARASGLECAAILDILLRIDGVSHDVYTRGKQLLVRIVSMLTSLRENPI